MGKSIEEVVMEKMVENVRKELEECYTTFMHEISLAERDYSADQTAAKANRLLNAIAFYSRDLQRLVSRYYAVADVSERIRQEIVQEIFDQNPGIGFGELNEIMSKRTELVYNRTQEGE